MQMTSEPMSAIAPSGQKRWLPLVLIGLALVFGLGITFALVATEQEQPKEKEKDKEKAPAKEPEIPADGNIAPELEGGTGWLNTGKPVKLKDLRGKIVLLDFWTFCCINCIHTLPDLAKLEKKYANQLVVIGVHSAKFDNEKDSENIRKAILRYEIKHPVVNDADMKIWDTYGARSWPTLVLIDVDGKAIGAASGEGNYELLDQVIAKLIDKGRKNKTLDEKPIRFDTAKFRDRADTPLYFPGKVVADVAGKRLLIADSTHHRVVITDMDGKKIAIAGTGHPGNKDGAFDKAQFDDPQGLAVRGDTVYVADRRNHTIRELDLKAQTVKTIAGTGEQDRGDRGEGGPALKRGLNSPWDLWLAGDRLFIAMAGHHQIWVMNLKANTVEPFAGSGRENIRDGLPANANFAQPSGLSSDGKTLYVADCEVSAVRKLSMDGKGEVETLIGRGLFDFGDRDGPARVEGEGRKEKEAQLQHAIAVAYHDGKVYVADTYNSKIKTIDLKSGMVTTFLGGPAKKGEERVLNEPAGLSIAGDTLYVADTNAHRIRVIDLKTKAIKTLELQGVPPVEQPKEVAVPSPKG